MLSSTPRACQGRWSTTRARAWLHRRGEHHDPDLGHVLHGVAKTFAAEAGVLDAAVGHVVDPIGRDVVDHHPADLELPERRPRTGQVVGEDAGLESEAAVV